MASARRAGEGSPLQDENLEPELGNQPQVTEVQAPPAPLPPTRTMGPTGIIEFLPPHQVAQIVAALQQALTPPYVPTPAHEAFQTRQVQSQAPTLPVGRTEQPPTTNRSPLHSHPPPDDLERNSSSQDVMSPARDNQRRERFIGEHAPPISNAEIRDLSRQRDAINKRLEEARKPTEVTTPIEVPTPTEVPTQKPPEISTPKRKNSPFCDAIADEVVNRKDPIPDIAKYNGRGDPNEHIMAFDNTMAVYGHTDNMHAKMFVTTLSGIALDWFTRLPIRSITSYEELCQKFKHQFASKRRGRMPANHLHSIVQAENETLRSFMARFSDELLTVETPPATFLQSVLYTNLRNTAFASELVRKHPKTWEAILDLAAEHMAEEEMSNIRASNALSTPKTHNNKDQLRQGRNFGNDKDGRQIDQRPRSPRRRAYENYTPLNASRRHILNIALTKGVPIKEARRMKETNTTRKSSKFCHYHQQTGHDTEDCYDLQDEFERLIRNGYLLDFVRAFHHNTEPSKETLNNRRRERSRSPRRDDRRDNRYRAEPRVQNNRNQGDNMPTRGIINMINGGPTGGDSMNSRKEKIRSLRRSTYAEGPTFIGLVEPPAPKITFDDSDLEGLPPQAPGSDHLDCPLVVTLDLANFAMKRVLVDNGSSANIIFLETLKLMELGNIKLGHVKTPLSGFGGGEVIPLGTVNLPMSLGSNLCRKTICLDFLVVDIPFAYNLIMGRPALNRFKAVASTYHQKLKFPTSSGVGEVLGNQRVAWECYTNSLDRRLSKTTQTVGVVGETLSSLSI